MEHDATSDAELVSALAAGDLGALRELYDRHAPWLSVRLARRCSDPDVVADALQDCFTSVWRDAGRWRGEGEVAAWLWGIAVRRLISRLRHERAVVVPTVPWAADAGSDNGSSTATGPSAEELVLLGIEYGGLAGPLDRLSPELRAVVQSRLLDGLSNREAARLLGIPPNTVKTRLHRAKAQLRADLARADRAGGLAGGLT
jgi:RNA polymerase sigma-70 factor (ECF subfamily)